MSNGRAFRRQVTDLLAPLDGARIPGGCDHCNAYQTTTPLAAGIWQLGIHHDDWCPVLNAMHPEPTPTNKETP